MSFWVKKTYILSQIIWVLLWNCYWISVHIDQNCYPRRQNIITQISSDFVHSPKFFFVNHLPHIISKRPRTSRNCPVFWHIDKTIKTRQSFERTLCNATRAFEYKLFKAFLVQYVTMEILGTGRLHRNPVIQWNKAC